MASLPVVGVLAVVGEDKAAAQQRPIDRIQRRTPQRNRNQRNNNQNNNQNNNTPKNSPQSTGKPCNANTCKRGCCTGTTCVLPAQQTNQQCGSNGAACAGCGVGGVGGVCRDGVCQACSTDTDCGAGLTCQNGGCFKACAQVGLCGTGCTDCHCDPTNVIRGPLACVDIDFPAPATCTSDADCPAGTVCDVFLLSGSDAYLCVRPCPCP